MDLAKPPADFSGDCSKHFIVWVHGPSMEPKVPSGSAILCEYFRPGHQVGTHGSRGGTKDRGVRIYPEDLPSAASRYDKQTLDTVEVITPLYRDFDEASTRMSSR
jgi:hypothetical protein